MATIIPRLVIAGTHSGAGKTTVTLGLLSALRRRNFRVQPFKVGPDFIDPSHHTTVSGVPSHNLDSWMLDRQTLSRIFEEQARGADIAVVEGVMGLFDGYDGKTERGSTAETAKLLGAPVILAIDASSMARSAAAIVYGFENFDPDLWVAGVVFNNVASPRHFAYLQEAVEGNCRTQILGYLPRNAAITLPERHLGLVMAQEGVLSPTLLDQLATIIEEHLSLEQILAIARKAQGIKDIGKPVGPAVVRKRSTENVRIGVAWDQAFCFYYQYNLDLLRSLGADIVFFSPLKDSTPPPDLRGIYLGGGYPELHAGALGANVSMRKALYAFADSGGPIYAECGGFMILTQEILDLEGCSHPMVGLFPTRAVMGRKLQSLGYVEAEAVLDSPLGQVGERIRGHEFRYSQIDPMPPEIPRSYRLFKSRPRGDSIDPPEEGYLYKNSLGSYVHLHFGSNPKWARRWLDLCASWV